MARLSTEESDKIWELYEADYSLTAIGESINRAKTTVRDFLIRNRWKRPKPSPGLALVSKRGTRTHGE